MGFQGVLVRSKRLHVDHIKAKRCYTLRMMSSCLHCNEPFTNRWQAKYCSNKCQHDYQYRVFIELWKTGSKDSMRKVATKNVSRHLKRYLIETNGEKCSECGWNKKHPTTKRVPLEVDHIDGNADNNEESNLRIICPNCHSLTVHFRNLNRTRGRKWRLLRSSR